MRGPTGGDASIYPTSEPTSVTPRPKRPRTDDTAAGASSSGAAESTDTRDGLGRGQRPGPATAEPVAVDAAAAGAFTSGAAVSLDGIGSGPRPGTAQPVAVDPDAEADDVQRTGAKCVPGGPQDPVRASACRPAAHGGHRLTGAVAARWHRNCPATATMSAAPSAPSPAAARPPRACPAAINWRGGPCSVWPGLGWGRPPRYVAP